MVKKQRLDKAIAMQGSLSRSEVKTLIRKGAVTVNGQVVKNADFGVDFDDCRFFGRIIVTDLFDVLTVTCFSAVHNDDAIERCFLCAHAGESEFNCHCFLLIRPKPL